MTKKIAAAVLALGLAVGFANACAGAAYVAGRRSPLSAPPADVLHTEERISGHDGLKLLTQSWQPVSGNVRGVVVIAHGLKDYSDRYAPFAITLAQHGYAVHALDHRGHGDSEGDRVWVASFNEYLKDFDFVVQKARAVNEESRCSSLATPWAETSPPATHSTSRRSRRG
jgi:pimeloyl-ACP methyl ester carboxylesterase